MKNLFKLFVLIISSFYLNSAFATLGQNPFSVGIDSANLGATFQKYNDRGIQVFVVRIPADNGGGVIYEYVNQLQDMVFAVSWHGVSHYMARQILGDYYPLTNFDNTQVTYQYYGDDYNFNGLAVVLPLVPANFNFNSLY